MYKEIRTNIQGILKGILNLMNMMLTEIHSEIKQSRIECYTEKILFIVIVLYIVLVRNIFRSRFEELLNIL